MKIMGMDNFGREDISEFFAITPKLGLSNVEKQLWCDVHNSDHSSVFFKLVEDDYELFIQRP